MRRIFIGLLFSLYASLAFASEALISCTASILGNTIMVEIVPTDSGIKAFGNGRLLNPNVKVTDFVIRQDIEYPLEDFSNYNHGELTLNGAWDAGLSFDVRKARKVRVYDLSKKNDSFSNKFGGQILFEVFNKEQKLLGRAVRIMKTGECQ